MTSKTRPHARPRPASWLVPAVAAALLVLGPSAGVASAHGPDPTLSGGPFGQNQVLRYRWRAGAEPPAFMRTAISNGANDVNASRSARAATYALDASGPNPVGYGLGATCGVNGAACFTRDVPDGFTMWFREQGHVYDWGRLRWCQAYSSPPDGCYDAETIALDEFAHVEGLGHHVNYADDSDYLDANVQTYSRTKPHTGWNVHTLGRCDIATLQMLYDMQTWTAKYSTCLDLSTDLQLAASPSGIINGASSTLTATLKVVDYASYGRLGGNPVSGRTVTLQSRRVGVTAWTTVGAMPAGSTSGTYVLAQRPGTDTDYRAIFGTPATEGVNGDTSPSVRVYVSNCTTAATRGPTIQSPCI